LKGLYSKERAIVVLKRSELDAHGRIFDDSEPLKRFLDHDSTFGTIRSLRLLKPAPRALHT
jgi:hypothetical protein